MSIFSKLSCCCSSAGRKIASEGPVAPPVSISSSHGQEEAGIISNDSNPMPPPAAMDMAELQQRAQALMRQRPVADESSELAKIRDVAFNLIKKATIDIVHARVINSTPNEAFAPVLGRELSKISQYEDFGELIKVVIAGPTPENREKAEKYAHSIAVQLIRETEKEVPMTLN